MNFDPLSKETIAKATNAFVASPVIGEKLAWWLKRGHACERWLQFEWAFLLEKALDGEFLVACEVNRIDIVCFRQQVAKYPLWENNPDAAIEVKFYGNWWFDPSFADVGVDIEKITDEKSVPGLALVFALFVTPQKGSRMHEWIDEQINNEKIGVSSQTEFESKLSEVIERPPDICVKARVPTAPGLESVELCAFGFYNSAAACKS